MLENSVPFILLDEKSAAPLYRQIYEAIRQAILSGEFQPTMPLPATRLLAKQLGVSRMTIINAYDQLFAEGYLEGRTGAGTYVASELPEKLLEVPDSRRRKTAENRVPPRSLNISSQGSWLSEIGANVLRLDRAMKFTPFQHGLPAFDEFPFDVWSRIAQNLYKKMPREVLGYGEPEGYRPLREAIAAHLKTTRGVICDYEQVIITAGAQHALTLAGKIFLEPGDEVWMEDPCYLGARGALLSAEIKPIAVPVDADGFDLSAALAKSKNAKLVYVTPSHQYPLGLTMSLARRLSLIDWARANDAWIIEDDYNSEFRYAGRPLASLQGLDRCGRVIYVGTFSKTIFPSLRLGCLVVPKDLVEVFTIARSLNDLHSPLIEQAILAEFIAEGHFARHLRRMRKLYEERQKILLGEAKKQLEGLLEVRAADAGMHLIGWLPDGFCAESVAEKAARNNLKVSPIASYSFNPHPPNGLILGYASYNERQIKEGVSLLKKVLFEKYD